MKKKIIATAAITVAILGGAILGARPLSTGAEDSPLVTQVQQQADELANHEGRIAKTEDDVSSLQTTTGTTSTVYVAQPSTVQPTPNPAPTPVTVVSYREIVIDQDTSDCEYTYSDSTTYQFHWKTTNQQGAWVTDGDGANGHWEKSTQTNGICNDRALGSPKTT